MASDTLAASAPSCSGDSGAPSTAPSPPPPGDAAPLSPASSRGESIGALPGMDGARTSDTVTCTFQIGNDGASPNWQRRRERCFASSILVQVVGGRGGEGGRETRRHREMLRACGGRSVDGDGGALPNAPGALVRGEGEYGGGRPEVGVRGEGASGRPGGRDGVEACGSVPGGGDARGGGAGEPKKPRLMPAPLPGDGALRRRPHDQVHAHA